MTPEHLTTPSVQHLSLQSAGTGDVIEFARGLAQAAADKKAEHLEIFDVRGKVDYADVVVVASGRSAPHIAALAQHLEKVAQQRYRRRTLSAEGLKQGTWVLIDFGDVVFHIFDPEARPYYDLGSLWVDASRVDIEPELGESA